MQNNKLFPFERNRFYSGKLLTSADFDTEQVYFNNKRRFLSRMMYGQGIVCGFGVYNLDDLSVMIESGMAIDGQGREVIIEKSAVKKLSAIEGFDKLKTERASLCVEYAESLAHPVYSLNKEQANKEYEYNRISEGYRLFLQDAEPTEESVKDEGEFIMRRRLYKDQDFAVFLRMPGKVTVDVGIRLFVEVEKLSEQNKSLSIKGSLQIPAFVSDHGEKMLQITLEGLEMEKGESQEFDFIMYSAGAKPMETNVIAKSSMFTITVDGLTMRSGDDLLIPVEILESTLKTVVSKEVGKISLENYFLQGNTGFIKLADIDLVRTDSAYIIENIVDAPPSSYIRTTAQSDLEESYLNYFTPMKSREELAPKLTPDHVQTAEVLSESILEPRFATGVCEIPIGLDTRAGDVVFSDEIMHGLGRGNIYVEVGLETIRENRQSGGASCDIIYGAADLFRESQESVPAFQTAVKVMTEKGTFAIAVRLMERTDLISMKIRWVALRFDDADLFGAIERFSDRNIIALPSTVVIAPRESCCFDVKFRNMEPTSISYEMTETDSGEIKSDGVYTAPAKEGVYEIKISCADTPAICTYAYAVVKKKGAE